MADHEADKSAGANKSVGSMILRAPIHKDDAIWKLEVMSRRGRLPGFKRTLGGFSVAAHGTPFDKTLHLISADAGDGSEFKPELQFDRKMPAITLAIFIVTVWPGVMLTDSFLRMHLGFYERWTTQGLVTWWWYVPLTIISLVMAWFSAIKKSTHTAASAANEAMQKIAAEIDGTIE